MLRTLVLTISLSLCVGIARAHEDAPRQISNLTQLLAEHPRDPDLYLQRGELYRLDGNWRAAEMDYATARAWGADASSVAVCRASLELNRGDPESALACLQQVAGVRTSALFLEGRALRQLGRFKEAAKALEQAVASSQRPRPGDYLELSETILEQGDALIPEALDVLDAGSQRLGPVASLTLAAAELEIRRGHYASALYRLRSAPSVLQRSPAWLTRQGEILVQAGSALEAQAVFTEALSLVQALPAHRRSAPATVALEEKLHEYLTLPIQTSSGASR